MTDLDRRLEADMAMRNSARRLVENDIRTLKGVLVPPGEATALVRDEAGHVTAMARAHPGKVAGIAAVLVALGLAWLFRGRLAGLFGGSPRDNDDDGSDYADERVSEHEDY